MLIKSLKQLRGQGYDGASNMRGEFNGLKSLIQKENDSAYYVHCFAHQLQLVVVAVAKNHKGVRDFFDVLSTVTNVVCGSCKRKDILRESHKEKVVKEIEKGEIEKGEIETGKGKNQEVTLARAGDTRWGSHH
ncbi:zinc finger MYM-type protein 1-like protein [Tanacetum coccineum]